MTGATRTTRLLVALAGASAPLVAVDARAQPNLPPPPPPPIERSPDAPTLPPPPPPPSAPPAATSTSPPPSSPPPSGPARRAALPPRPAATVYVAPHTAHDGFRFSEENAARPIALTLNPLPLAWGRVGGNVEVLLAPHHALVGSANVLLSNVNRGGLLAEALGFAQKASSGFGAEVGYHYWWYSSGSLQGPFAGPSLLLGSTTNATVGAVPDAQSYWGVALDAGWQAVLPSGFTAGGGIGLGLVRMADAGAVFPRFLAQLGWSF